MAAEEVIWAASWLESLQELYMEVLVMCSICHGFIEHLLHQCCAGERHHSLALREIPV